MVNRSLPIVSSALAAEGDRDVRSSGRAKPGKVEPSRAKALKLIASRKKHNLKVVLNNGVEVLLPPILVGEAALAFGKESGLLNAKGQFAKRFR
ncbi:hypothetical protein GCM10007320_34980 [Pseudorhodoferax aquiterrae]|uniref:Uncharacterized protein n=1 Tax=Pseudorhodoferax aquiterrae TaxID=747304 RepID=A0ABQ3G3U4_9BURK|nr:hypothetical protein [Pseudorhodoferax aquiterrae]GHC88114.1 hypothetical protein GCM10007320_34980 [Pseudorhodoferax aquiterrae]